MSQLGQQALEVPTHVREVRLKLGGAPPCWFGVDAATERLNVSWVVEPGAELSIAPDANHWVAEDGYVRGVQSVRLGGVHANEGMRLNIVNGQVDQLIGAMHAAGIPLPGAVYLEHPAGEYPKPQLYYTVGITAAAIYEAVRRRTGWVPHVELTTSGHWKLVACGKGQIPKYVATGELHAKGKSKGKKKKRKLGLEEYGVMQWARLNGYTGMSWDDADCMAIGDAARKDVAISVLG